MFRLNVSTCRQDHTVLETRTTISQEDCVGHVVEGRSRRNKQNYVTVTTTAEIGQSVQCLTTDWTTRRTGFTSVPRPALRPTQPPVQSVPGVLSPRLKPGQGVTMTTQPHLVPRSRMSWGYATSPPPPQAPPWLCSGTALVALYINVYKHNAPLISQGKTLIKKLKVVQLFKKVLFLLVRSPKAFCRVHWSPPPAHILIQTNSDHTLLLPEDTLQQLLFTLQREERTPTLWASSCVRLSRLHTN
jgi:hypothetical protein